MLDHLLSFVDSTLLYLYTKKDEEWVIWNDSQYYHKINATHLAKGKEELQKMAQSLYLNN